MSRIIIVLTAIIGIAISSITVYLFSTTIDFKDGTAKDTYVIWGPLVAYWFALGLLLASLLRLLAIKQYGYLPPLVCLAAAGLLYSTSYISYDQQADLEGRWAGFLISVAMVIVFAFDLLKQMRST